MKGPLDTDSRRPNFATAPQWGDPLVREHGCPRPSNSAGTFPHHGCHMDITERNDRRSGRRCWRAGSITRAKNAMAIVQSTSH